MSITSADRTAEAPHETDRIPMTVGYFGDGREMTATTCTRCGGIYRAGETCAEAGRYAEAVTR